jgi:hypothetical protein
LTSSLPHWVQVIQALGPTAVALSIGVLAGVIAYRQWETAQIRLKLDLFKERFEVFQVLDEINKAWRGSTDNEWVGEYIGRMNQARERIRKFKLLFPPEIESKIDQLVEAWHDFTSAKAEGEGLNKPSPEWSEHVRLIRRRWDAIENHNKELRAAIEGFIRVNWKG